MKPNHTFRLFLFFSKSSFFSVEIPFRHLDFSSLVLVEEILPHVNQQISSFFGVDGSICPLPIFLIQVDLVLLLPCVLVNLLSLDS